MGKPGEREGFQCIVRVGGGDDFGGKSQIPQFCGVVSIYS